MHLTSSASALFLVTLAKVALSSHESHGKDHAARRQTDRFLNANAIERRDAICPPGAPPVTVTRTVTVHDTRTVTVVQGGGGQIVSTSPGYPDDDTAVETLEPGPTPTSTSTVYETLASSTSTYYLTLPPAVPPPAATTPVPPPDEATTSAIPDQTVYVTEAGGGGTVTVVLPAEAPETVYYTEVAGGNTVTVTTMKPPSTTTLTKNNIPITITRSLAPAPTTPAWHAASSPSSSHPKGNSDVSCDDAYAVAKSACGGSRDFCQTGDFYIFGKKPCDDFYTSCLAKATSYHNSCTAKSGVTCNAWFGELMDTCTKGVYGCHDSNSKAGAYGPNKAEMVQGALSGTCNLAHSRCEPLAKAGFKKAGCSIPSGCGTECYANVFFGQLGWNAAAYCNTLPQYHGSDRICNYIHNQLCKHEGIQWEMCRDCPSVDICHATGGKTTKKCGIIKHELKNEIQMRYEDCLQYAKNNRWSAEVCGTTGNWLNKALAMYSDGMQESYPNEFVSHHLPLLMVAGLGPAPPPPPVPGAAPAAPSSPSAGPEAPTDPFLPLLAALRKSLTTRKQFPIWDNSRGANNDFHVVLVDKNVRFPPLKARPQSGSAAHQPQQALHSPISPLSPSSPLHPDGIMAPIWIRKHREMVPAVFILVLRLFSVEPSSGLDQLTKDDLERTQDADLVRDITERKRSTVERGIKLAVILVCSRALLDDPLLDSRLSLIRRQAGLDSRASLFVISPVPQTEVNNFAASFKGELFPAAMDYYREHGRRVRRKRARMGGKGRLSEKGWNVRYDYKMATFAEMRGEIEVALKHYEDCYETLVDMFATPALLTPRTKRWAEAKVLADCLTVKVCKMYLYLNEPARSVGQLNKHVARFRDLSNTWGIGEQTFEFWSWLSKQYRLFADLVAIATRAGFRLPSLRPPPAPRSVPAGMPQPPSPGLVPPTVLQHAGYYFHMAALCAIQRRECFAALELEEGAPVSPAVAHESKVDHSEIIIDLYTKAYEYFKAHKSSRQSLFIASQIALTHFQAGNHDLALKFNERISRTYRREKWRTILDSILELSYVSAKVVGDHDTTVRTLVGLIAPDSKITVEKRAGYASELLEFLRTTPPATPEAGIITIDSADTAPLLSCSLVFWSPNASVGQSAAFQLSLLSPPSSASSSLRFSRLELAFSGGATGLVVVNDDGRTGAGESVEGVQLGSVGEGGESETRLVWGEGQEKLFMGTIRGGGEMDLLLETATLTLLEGDWTVRLVLRPDADARPPVWRTLSPPSTLFLLQPNPSVCLVRPRSLRIQADIRHAAPAYLGEQFQIVVDVKNEDDVEVEVFLDILLQPGDEDSHNELWIDSDSSSSLIKAFSLGVLSPSSSLLKPFRLLCIGPPGERQLDVSIRAQPTLLSESAAAAAPTEILRTLAIDAVTPFLAAFDTHFHRRRRAPKHLLDFEEVTGWEGASDVTMIAKLCARGPWELEVVGIRLACEETPDIRVVQSSVQGGVPLDLTWRPQDYFNVIYKLEVMAAVSEEDATIPSRPLLEVLWRRKGDSTLPPTRTLLPLSIRPLPLTPTISVRLPPYMTLHVPTLLTYRLSNPTERLLSLSLQIDSADGFVFAGPRKIAAFVLAPAEERLVPISVIPLVVGPCVVPRVRIFEILPPPMVQDGEEDVKAEARSRELTVVEEEDVDQVGDPAQAHLETDLRAARDSERDEGGSEGGERRERPFTVLVLPP